MRTIWPWAALAWAITPAFGQPSGDARALALKQVCAQVPCRSAGTFTLRTRDGGTGQVDIDPYPYLDPDGDVVIYPGEAITLALAKDGSGKARLLKVIDAGGTHEFAKAAVTEATLELRFGQMDGRPDMMLNLQNATNATIKYDAVQFVIGSHGLQPSPTSSCPVFAPGPGQASFGGIEHWPYPIVNLLIHNIRPLHASADRTCK